MGLSDPGGGLKPGGFKMGFYGISLFPDASWDYESLPPI